MIIGEKHMVNIIDFVRSSTTLTELSLPNRYVVFDGTDLQNTGWKVRHFSDVELAVRKYFDLFGVYENTRSANVIRALKEGLKKYIAFDEDVKSIRGILRVAKAVFLMEEVKVLPDSVMPVELIDIREKVGNEKKLMHTFTYIEANRSMLEEMKKERIGFKIRARDKNHLSIRVESDAITILAKKNLGVGGFKSVKTSYDVEKKQAIARAVSVVRTPGQNFIMNAIDDLFIRGLATRNESKFLEMVKGDPTCIQLQSCYKYTAKNGSEKSVMLMELADGDLLDLVFTRLTEDQRFDIASQLIAALVSLSKRNIWHRDIKPLNFLYFLKDGKYRIVISDFGLSTDDRSLFGQKCVGGTRDYIAPENFNFFRLQNGKEGDIYSLGKTFCELFPSNLRPAFIRVLIDEMLQSDPAKRIKAEELQVKFNELQVEYISNKEVAI